MARIILNCQRCGEEYDPRSVDHHETLCGECMAVLKSEYSAAAAATAKPASPDEWGCGMPSMAVREVMQDQDTEQDELASSIYESPGWWYVMWSPTYGAWPFHACGQPGQKAADNDWYLCPKCVEKVPSLNVGWTAWELGRSQVEGASTDPASSERASESATQARQQASRMQQDMQALTEKLWPQTRQAQKSRVNKLHQFVTSVGENLQQLSHGRIPADEFTYDWIKRGWVAPDGTFCPVSEWRLWTNGEGHYLARRRDPDPDSPLVPADEAIPMAMLHYDVGRRSWLDANGTEYDDRRWHRQGEYLVRRR